MPIEYQSSMFPTLGSKALIKGVRFTITNAFWPSITVSQVTVCCGLTFYKSPTVTLKKGQSVTWSATFLSSDWTQGMAGVCATMTGRGNFGGSPFAVCGVNPFAGKPSIKAGVTWTKYWDGGTASGTCGCWRWLKDWGQSVGLKAKQSVTEQLHLLNHVTGHKGNPFPGSEWTFSRARDTSKYKVLSITVASR